jgi:hypothetical protein
MAIQNDNQRIASTARLRLFPPLPILARVEEPFGACLLHGTTISWNRRGFAVPCSAIPTAIQHSDERLWRTRPGLACPQHLTNRIGFLVMDPQNHPDLGHSRLAVGSARCWRKLECESRHGAPRDRDYRARGSPATKDCETHIVAPGAHFTPRTNRTRDGCNQGLDPAVVVRPG